MGRGFLQRNTSQQLNAETDIARKGAAVFHLYIAFAKSHSSNQNIVQLQLTEQKLYALSASGKLYVLAGDVLRQSLPKGAPRSTGASWWSFGWLWGKDETTDFAEVSPREPFGWGES